MFTEKYMPYEIQNPEASILLHGLQDRAIYTSVTPHFLNGYMELTDFFWGAKLTKFYEPNEARAQEIIQSGQRISEFRDDVILLGTLAGLKQAILYFHYSREFSENSIGLFYHADKEVLKQEIREAIKVSLAGYPEPVLIEFPDGYLARTGIEWRVG